MEFDIDQVLLGNYIQNTPYGSSSGSLQIYLPDLMPNISMGKPKITPVALNYSCFINANDCKPSIASMINTQNYVTALASYNPYKFPKIYFGSQIAVRLKSKDGLSCRLSPEDKDPSSLY